MRGEIDGQSDSSDRHLPIHRTCFHVDCYKFCVEKNSSKPAALHLREEVHPAAVFGSVEFPDATIGRDERRRGDPETLDTEQPAPTDEQQNPPRVVVLPQTRQHEARQYRHQQRERTVEKTTELFQRLFHFVPVEW